MEADLQVQVDEMDQSAIVILGEQECEAEEGAEDHDEDKTEEDGMPHWVYYRGQKDCSAWYLVALVMYQYLPGDQDL